MVFADYQLISEPFIVPCKRFICRITFDPHNRHRGSTVTPISPVKKWKLPELKKLPGAHSYLAEGQLGQTLTIGS